MRCDAWCMRFRCVRTTFSFPLRFFLHLAIHTLCNHGGELKDVLYQPKYEEDVFKILLVNDSWQFPLIWRQLLWGTVQCPNHEGIGTPLTKMKRGEAHLLDGGFGGRLGSLTPFPTIVEEVEWRPPCANTLDHRVPATLKIHQISRDGLVKPQARCARCMRFSLCCVLCCVLCCAAHRDAVCCAVRCSVVCCAVLHCAVRCYAVQCCTVLCCVCAVIYMPHMPHRS